MPKARAACHAIVRPRKPILQTAAQCDLEKTDTVAKQTERGNKRSHPENFVD